MFWNKSAEQVSPDAEKEILRGTVEVIDQEHLLSRVKKGEKLRVKLGIDPTGPNLHIGHSVNLLKLRDFQEMGHTIIFIVGDATGVIGDTSDKDSERPMLEHTTIAENMKTYLKQVGTIIDTSRAEIKYNSKWLNKLTYEDIGPQAAQFSLSDFIARDNIKRRLDAGKRVSFRETFYPLMQGYDSVAIAADVEIGGTDQRFNMLSGRTLQKHYEQEPQDVVMMELLVGTDGQKMSKSLGNTVNLIDEPNDMFGKIMRIRDEHIDTYFTLATRVPEEEIKAGTGKNPRDRKLDLAQAITALYHGESTAKEAREHFVKVFSKKEVPEHFERVRGREGEDLAATLEQGSVVSSRSEFRRLVQEGAVSDIETGEKLVIPKTGKLTVREGMKLKIGKRRFIEIVLK